MGETTRQIRIQKQLQQDLAELYQAEAKTAFKGSIISITKVRITSDLMDAKVYISAFPLKDKTVFMEYIDANASRIKGELGSRIRHQMRRVPNIEYIFDDSLDYVDEIDKALKGNGVDLIKESKNKK
ncbi:MAG: ribosome-binding factor A [Ichthyobacteriaceae bacterium]|nr:ribosome-binding factor A [Ichthyobacteriaceae bacterium]